MSARYKGGGGGSAAGAITMVSPPKYHPSAVTTSEFSGLDGNADHNYHGRWSLMMPAGSEPGYRLLINGAITNINYQRILGGSVTNPAAGDAPTTNAFAGSGNGGQCIIDIDFHAKVSTGKLRGGTISIAQQNSGGSTVRVLELAFTWNDTTTNVTSFGIGSDTASGIAAETRGYLWKMGGA